MPSTLVNKKNVRRRPDATIFKLYGRKKKDSSDAGDSTKKAKAKDNKGAKAKDSQGQDNAPPKSKRGRKKKNEQPSQEVEGSQQKLTEPQKQQQQQKQLQKQLENEGQQLDTDDQNSIKSQQQSKDSLNKDSEGGADVDQAQDDQQGDNVVENDEDDEVDVDDIEDIDEGVLDAESIEHDDFELSEQLEDMEDIDETALDESSQRPKPKTERASAKKNESQDTDAPRATKAGKGEQKEKQEDGDLDYEEDYFEEETDEEKALDRPYVAAALYLKEKYTKGQYFELKLDGQFGENIIDDVFQNMAYKVFSSYCAQRKLSRVKRSNVSPQEVVQNMEKVWVYLEGDYYETYNKSDRQDQLNRMMQEKKSKKAQQQENQVQQESKQEEGPVYVSPWQDGLGFDEDRIFKLVARQPRILGATIDNLHIVTETLHKLDLRQGEIQRLVTFYPRVLLQQNQEKLLPYVDYLCNTFSITPNFAANTIARYPPILGYTIEQLSLEIDFYLRNDASLEYVLYRMRDGVL